MIKHFELTLETRVPEIMNPKPLVVSGEEPATGLRRLFRESKERIALVIDRSHKLEGIVYRGDVLVVSSTKSNARVRDLLHPPILVIRDNSVVREALQSMLKADEWYAPVVDSSGKVVGVLGLEHVIRRMLDENEEYISTKKVNEIMTSDVESVIEDEYASNVWWKMIEMKYAGLPVTDSKGRLVGIVTQYDFLRHGVRISLESGSGPSRGPRIREIMTRSVEYTIPEASASEPARLIVERGFGRIPVVEARSRMLEGIVDREDIARLVFS